MVDLVPGGNEECVIALIESQSKQFWVPWRKRQATTQGDYLEDQARAFVKIPFGVNILLVDSNNHMLHAGEAFELLSTNDGPQATESWGESLQTP